ncbi:MAG: preprotein translocase subunit SecE [Candidatus Poribacteria bacterium]|nr:preprotein translocase subunit SecE [Candidatus Poribacteria bacterium]
MIAQIKRYLQETQLEWQKVSKPDRKEVQSNTLVVIVACACLGLFLWLVDGSSLLPNWTSLHGAILIVPLTIAIFLIARAILQRWRTALLISLIPLAVVLMFEYVLDQSLRGFGMALLRSLFIQ